MNRYPYPIYIVLYTILESSTPFSRVCLVPRSPGTLCHVSSSILIPVPPSVLPKCRTIGPRFLERFGVRGVDSLRFWLQRVDRTLSRVLYCSRVSTPTTFTTTPTKTTTKTTTTTTEGNFFYRSSWVPCRESATVEETDHCVCKNLTNRGPRRRLYFPWNSCLSWRWHLSSRPWRVGQG